MPPARTEKSEPLIRRIWWAYFRTALIPLLLVEVALVGVYLGANKLAQRENTRAIRRVADDELSRIAVRESVVIERELSSVRSDVQVFAAAAGRALQEPVPEGAARDAALAAYAKSDEGMVYKLADTGGGALYYSAATKVGDAEWDKVLRAERLDPLMKSFAQNDPLVVQLYFNSYDSMNRIYPFLDAQKQYAPAMEIPSYNFYYEADLAHNPGRGAVWTDVYVDPAGQGWMASCIAPVYRGDFLEGVVGFDITVATLVKQVLDLKIPWDGYGMLIGKTGTILALPAGGETDFKLTELTKHDYQKAIVQDTFKPDDFNLYKRADLADLPARMQSADAGEAEMELGGDHRVAAWSTVKGTGWKLLVVVPRAEIYSQASTLGQRLSRIALYMIAGMVVFYAGFFAWLYRRARRMALYVAEPLGRINALVGEIGAGKYEQTFEPVGVDELDATAEGVVAMGRRIGEHDRQVNAINEDMRLAKDEAVSAARAKSDFLARMSHEIRTPMNGVLGMTDLLLETDLEPTQKEYGNIIRSSAHSLLQVINDILDFSRIDAGRMVLTKAVVDLSEVLEGTLDLVGQRAAEKGLDLVLRVGEGFPATVMGDGGRLRQVLLNLVANAVKFTDEGQAVVTASVTSSGAEKITLRFEVEDSGIGVDLADQERIFDPFAQADDSMTRRHGGTGLGLAISKQLVTLMGGKMGLRSVPGEGATFWFEVPFARVEPSSPLVAPLPELRRLRALVVEDNPYARSGLVDRIRAMGARAEGAASREEALAMIEDASGRFDIVFVDHGIGDAARPRLQSSPILAADVDLDAEAGRGRLPSSPGPDSEVRGQRGMEIARAIRAVSGGAGAAIVLLLPMGMADSDLPDRSFGRLRKPVRQKPLFARLLAATAGEKAPVSAKRPAASGPITPRSGRRTTVLLVEDNEVNRKVAKLMLDALGCDVRLATNGHEAIAEVDKGGVDLILMDAHMPGMDGYEATRRLRARERAEGRARMPIVALTAHALVTDRDRSLEAGMDDHLSKPVDIDELQRTVRRWTAPPSAASGGR